MAGKKDLEYYIAQARRIAEHREAGAEREIRRLYKGMLKDLQTFVSETYVQLAKDDRLTYAMLQEAGYNARFLEEIEQRLNISTPKAAKELRQLVEETYDAAYKAMVDGVARASGGLETEFAESIAITPEQVKRAVENPVSGLTLSDTLEKNRREIIYSIKRTVGVGLMNGDRYTTMARRIAEQLDGDYKKAIRIARTEAHRVREAGNCDAARYADSELQKGTTGMRMCKTWKNMKDERVRPQRRRRGKKGWSTRMGKGANHMILDGQTVLAGEDFDLQDGHTASAPGNSGVAGHDINCRCYASYEMLTDAEFFARTGKHFPGAKAEGRLENAENSGIIYAGGVYDEFDRKLQLYSDDEDLAAVNPNYSTGKYEWLNNCQRCVSTYEMRMRGFDVTAKALPGKLQDDYLAQWFEHAWENAERKWCLSGSGKKQVETLMAQWGDGARAVVGVGFSSTTGHVFFAIQENGKTRYVDPQNPASDCSLAFKLAIKGRTYVTRVDNLEPSEHIFDCCENRR